MGHIKDSFEQEVGVAGDLMLAMGNDGLGHAASSDEMGVFKVGQEFVDQTVDHGGSTIEDAALHTFERISSYEMAWFLYGDGGQLRGALAEGIQGGLYARDDHAAKVGLVFVDDADGGRRAEVDDCRLISGAKSQSSGSRRLCGELCR